MKPKVRLNVDVLNCIYDVCDMDTKIKFSAAMGIGPRSLFVRQRCEQLEETLDLNLHDDWEVHDDIGYETCEVILGGGAVILYKVIDKLVFSSSKRKISYEVHFYDENDNEDTHTVEIPETTCETPHFWSGFF